MLRWLASTCAQQRRERGVTQGRIAAALDSTERSVGRFENGKSWPRDPGRVVDIYAQELDLEPAALWMRAVMDWCAHDGTD